MKDFLWCNTAKILWRKCQMSDHIYKHLSWFPRRLGRKCQMIRMIFPRHVALAPVIRQHVKDFKSANTNTRQRQWWYSYFLDMLGIPLVSIIVAAHSAAVSFMNRWTDDVMCSMCLQTNDYVRAQLTHNWHLACRRSYFQDMSPEMEKVGDTGDISLLFFFAGANFWTILGNVWAILAIFGHFWVIMGNFG